MRRLLPTPALSLMVLGCAGANAPTQPTRSLTGAWTGASAELTLDLDLQSSGSAVSGRGWIAQDRTDGVTPGTFSRVTPVAAIPVLVTGVAYDSTFTMTLTPDLPPGASLGYPLNPVVLRGTARGGTLDVQFDFTIPGVRSPGAQAAVLTTDPDSVARGQFTIRARPPAGGAPRVDVVRTASAWSYGPGSSAFGIAAYHGGPSVYFSFLPALGRPAVGRYALTQGLGGQPVGAFAGGLTSCVTGTCPGYGPTTADPGELVITRSTPRALSGTYQFTGVRASGGLPPDTLVFEGAFDAPCASRGC